MRILACVDGSPYTAAVCDYAAWLTGPLEQHVSLLHVIERDSDPARRKADELLASSTRRLIDSGLEDVGGFVEEGRFPKAAASAALGHSMLVAGKRGETAIDDRLSLGSQVEPLLRATDKPVCLVSSLFLPVARCLILLDSDLAHTRTVDFVSQHAWLAELDTDVVVMTDGSAGDEKLAWARDRLGASGADIYPFLAADPHDALARYRQDHPIDLLVVSREVALADDAAPLQRIEADSLWAWRAPIMVC